MHSRTLMHAIPLRAPRWCVLTSALVATMLIWPTALPAQSHDHGAHGGPPSDARLDLVLGGPHLILYHRGYLALGDAQVTDLLPLRRRVCEAEQTYVEHAQQWREGLTALLDDSAMLAQQSSRDTTSPTRLHDAMMQRARAESQWLTVLLETRRDALAVLTPSQRTQLSALRTHWARESMTMIEEATRPGQRGHPGTQIPIRVPGMVVGETTLLPYCEALHGPSSHISIPPPR